MAYVLLAILLLGLLLIATEHINRMNKAAVAMFVGVICWLLYIIQGGAFVAHEHAAEYASFLSSCPESPGVLKEFIASHIFVKYVAKSAEVVLFLIATTTIVEVLNNNGCFDFLAPWLKTRQPITLLWTLALITFILSAHIDNLTIVVLLVGIFHSYLPTEKLRRIYTVVILLAANCGGSITVIGDVTSLKLWTDGLVEPTPYFVVLILPVLTALVVTLLLLQKFLPSRISYSFVRLPFRGDDTILKPWQRILMLFVGIGGLWFIPTFHKLTQLPPFVGALCVLGLLWIVNELCNRRLMQSDRLTGKRIPIALQYLNTQNILFFIGLVLMFGAVSETGLMHALFIRTTENVQNVYLINLVMSTFSAIFGNVPALICGISIFNHPDFLQHSDVFASGGLFWPMLSYATALGSCLLSTASIAGIMMMRMESITFGWYLRHIAPKVLAGLFAGFVVLWLLTTYAL